MLSDGLLGTICVNWEGGKTISFMNLYLAFIEKEKGKMTISQDFVLFLYYSYFELPSARHHFRVMLLCMVLW